ncbi:MAG: STAS domain-containing protein [Clostridia bacterium]|nr:STAS domain-containing protein [Clostridia bacterium]
MYKREVSDNFIDIKDERDSVVFTLKEELTDGNLIIGIAGSLQTDAVYEFEDEVLAALSVCDKAANNQAAFRNLTFDLSRISYISSAALRSFLKFQSIIDKYDSMHMSVVNPSAPVMSRLEETGYVDILDIKVFDNRPEE